MQNKTGKYLKYAIGEIVLVVIGILIALQINTWNEQRKQNQLELNALSEIREDLISSSWDIRTNLEQMNNMLESAWKIKRLIHTSGIFPDSLGFDLLAMTHDESLIPSSKTYTALKSTGFKLIRNDVIRRKLDGLYEAQFPRLQSNTSIEPDIKTYFSDYIKNNFIAFSTDTLYRLEMKAEDISRQDLNRLAWGKHSRYVPVNFDQMKNDPEFSILLENSIRWRAIKIFRYRDTMKSTQEVINLIEESLKGKINLSQIRDLRNLLTQENGFEKVVKMINLGNVDEQVYNISEDGINALGYELINQGRNNEALEILKLNTELYPNGYNSFDSYGEILLKMGDVENAIKAYNRSLELNPANENAKKVLLEIK